jgi:hypothetical protein
MMVDGDSISLSEHAINRWKRMMREILALAQCLSRRPDESSHWPFLAMHHDSR